MSHFHLHVLSREWRFCKLRCVMVLAICCTDWICGLEVAAEGQPLVQ